MATFKAADLFHRAVRATGEGNAQVYWGTIKPTAGASGDIYRIMKLPAGFHPTLIQLFNGDADTGGTPTIAFKMGYKSIAGTTDGDDDDAYIATGDTSLQSANTGKFFHVDPRAVKVLSEDKWLEIVLTAAAATFASVDITVVMYGDGLGAK